MDQTKRREEILSILRKSENCVTAARLAEHFGVTRQVIVADIAILRANGKKILATRYGYCLPEKPQNGRLECIACRHPIEKIREEFYAVVDHGGAVLNVMVEHPLYGEISADLNIRSRFEADEFVAKAAELGAAQLCDLTDGRHLHMISVPNEAALLRIKAALQELGILEEEK